MNKKEAKKLGQQAALQAQRKGHLKRELDLGIVSWKILKEKWQKILNKTKVSEIKEDGSSLNRWLDAKDAQLKLLIHEIDSFDRYQQFVAQQHAESLHCLFELFLQRIQSLYLFYKKRKQKSVSEGKAEFSAIVKGNDITTDNFQILLSGAEAGFKREEEVLKCDMFSSEQVCKDEMLELVLTMKHCKEEKVNSLWENVMKQVQLYHCSHPWRVQILKMVKKNDEDSKIIQEEAKKVTEFTDLTTSLNNRLLENYPTLEFTCLQDESNKFYLALTKLKNQLKHDLKEDRSRLSCLCIVTEKLLKELQRQETKGTRILSMHSICRKFETEKEKVIPANKRKFLQQKPINPMGSRQEFVKNDFSNIWLKQGLVTQSMRSIQKRICILTQENIEYRQILKRILHQTGNSR